MCYMKHLDENLLVVGSAEALGLQAFLIETGKVKSIKTRMRLPGQNRGLREPVQITASNQGHLFVFDANNRCNTDVCCVRWSVSGVFDQGSGTGFGTTTAYETTSQLLVSHTKDHKVFISVLNVA